MPRPVSVVVPCFDEGATLRELHRQIAAMAARADYDLQLVFVDDGSRDDSWSTIEALAAEDPRVEGVRFRRNFGKAAALVAGFDAAVAPVVVTIDADLQDDPAEIPALVGLLDQGYDIGSGWKVDRQDPWHKRWPSLAFNGLVSWLTGVSLHDHNCGLKAYRREVLDELTLYGELHRFVPVLAASRGFRTAEAAVHHRPRLHGKSKYGVSRLLKGLLDLITVKFLTSYGDRPQHLLGGVGLVSFALGAACLGWLAVRWVVSRSVPGLEAVHLHETASLYYALALCLVGGQFLSIGLLGAMITSALAPGASRYSVAERTPTPTRAPGVIPGPSREAS
ncbi:MAG: glycosyltransferase family 2 protein [Lacipirellulaceae bacterium]